MLVVASSTLSWLSSLALVLGALLVGDAINGAVVTNQYPITAPAAVLRVLFGAVLIWLGARVRTAPEYVPSEDTDGESTSNAPESGTETHDFDPELSPLGDREPRDDRREATDPEVDDTESGVAGSAAAGADGDTGVDDDGGAEDGNESADGEDAGSGSAGGRGRRGGS